MPWFDVSSDFVRRIAWNKRKIVHSCSCKAVCCQHEHHNCFMIIHLSLYIYILWPKILYSCVILIYYTSGAMIIRAMVMHVN
jgi:hypothetical protein